MFLTLIGTFPLMCLLSSITPHAANSVSHMFISLHTSKPCRENESQQLCHSSAPSCPVNCHTSVKACPCNTHLLGSNRHQTNSLPLSEIVIVVVTTSLSLLAVGVSHLRSNKLKQTHNSVF